MPQPRRARSVRPVSIHQLKVTLIGIKPPIWRRLELSSESTLFELHRAIQGALTWDEAHLHQFTMGQITYGIPEMSYDADLVDETTTRLGSVAPGKGARLRYEYDFGDSWEHLIAVEAIKAPEPDVRYPRCTGGERAGPPEDCGGIWGYMSLLETLADPSNPEYEEMLDWLGEPISPEAFDLDATNERIRTYTR